VVKLARVEAGDSAKGPAFPSFFHSFPPPSLLRPSPTPRPRCIAAPAGRGGAAGVRPAHMPEKRERHDKLDLMTVAKKRDMKVGRAGRTDRN